jgi:hypothetical protein
MAREDQWRVMSATLPERAKFTAMVLAFWADKETGIAQVFTAKLASSLSVSPKTAGRRITDLVTRGEIAVIDRSGGRGRAPKYLVLTGLDQDERVSRLMKALGLSYEDAVRKAAATLAQKGDSVCPGLGKGDNAKRGTKSGERGTESPRKGDKAVSPDSIDSDNYEGNEIEIDKKIIPFPTEESPEEPEAPPEEIPDPPAAWDTVRDATPTGSQVSNRDCWLATHGQLELQINPATFETWVRDAKFLSFDAGTLRLKTRNQYAAEWLTQRLGRSLTHTYSGIRRSPVTRLEVSPDGRQWEVYETTPVAAVGGA